MTWFRRNDKIVLRDEDFISLMERGLRFVRTGEWEMKKGICPGAWFMPRYKLVLRRSRNTAPKRYTWIGGRIS